MLCGRCVEACQNVEVNETLSINWEDPNPRVLWDGGKPIGESSCVSCGHCVTVCPCNALMEKSMLGEAGYMSGLPKPVLNGMIDVIKGIEPETGYGMILNVSEAESAMRESRTRKNENGLHLLRCRMQLRCVDQGPPHPESGARRRAGQWHFHLRQRKVWLGFRQQSRPANQTADPRGRHVSRGHLGGSPRVGGAPFCRDQGQRRTRRAGLHLLVEMHQ